MSLPTAYLRTVKRVPDVLDAIKKAGVPDRFTHEFLKQMGFTSSADRPIVGMLKSLRFLDDSGAPTDRYRRYRDPAESGAVLAEALRDTYADIFTINENAHQLQRGDLKGLFQRASGKGERVSEAMADTFAAFTRLADFSGTRGTNVASSTEIEEVESPPVSQTVSPHETVSAPSGVGTGVILHHDVHVHLPESTDIAVYAAIFKALREHLLA